MTEPIQTKPATFDHHDIHDLLCKKALSPLYRSVSHVDRQALFCPYYVTLDGVLGADWGIIVNPTSSRFGLLTFEHDFCGCPPHPEGSQRTDEWLDRKRSKESLQRRVAAMTEAK